MTELLPDFLRRNDDRSSRRESALTFPMFARRNWSGLTSAATSDNERDAGFNWNPVQGDVASNPARTAGSARERLAFDDGGGREGKRQDILTTDGH